MNPTIDFNKKAVDFFNLTAEIGCSIDVVSQLLHADLKPQIICVDASMHVSLWPVNAEFLYDPNDYDFTIYSDHPNYIINGSALISYDITTWYQVKDVTICNIPTLFVRNLDGTIECVGPTLVNIYYPDKTHVSGNIIQVHSEKPLESNTLGKVADDCLLLIPSTTPRIYPNPIPYNSTVEYL